MASTWQAGQKTWWPTITSNYCPLSLIIANHSRKQHKRVCVHPTTSPKKKRVLFDSLCWDKREIISIFFVPVVELRATHYSYFWTMSLCQCVCTVSGLLYCFHRRVSKKLRQKPSSISFFQEEQIGQVRHEREVEKRSVTNERLSFGPLDTSNRWFVTRRRVNAEVGFGSSFGLLDNPSSTVLIYDLSEIGIVYLLDLGI